MSETSEQEKNHLSESETEEKPSEEEKNVTKAEVMN
jgi:hypothetical protein